MSFQHSDGFEVYGFFLLKFADDIARFLSRTSVAKNHNY